MVCGSDYGHRSGSIGSWVGVVQWSIFLWVDLVVGRSGSWVDLFVGRCGSMVSGSWVNLADLVIDLFDFC